MTDQKRFAARLLLAAFMVAGIAATRPASAQSAGYSDIVRAEPISVVAQRPVARGRAYAAPRRAHFLPAAHDRFDPIPAPIAPADALPQPRDNRSTLRLLPITAHYDHAPSGLDDDPTTFGLVASF
jgi:hypothetical protein